MVAQPLAIGRASPGESGPSGPPRGTFTSWVIAAGEEQTADVVDRPPCAFKAVLELRKDGADVVLDEALMQAEPAEHLAARVETERGIR
ncbi:hypothetical protein [Amycolatopsis sp. lyj-23]|uniref:hypothetical protein n=1 Tax=Amycolatopsis sp. lyj-23 TaxID=2789283 RepID=UPI003977FED3